MRVLVFLLALLFSGGAFGQGIGGGGVGGNDLTYKFVTPSGGSQTTLGAALSSPNFPGPVNTTAATGYQINGTNGLSIIPSSNGNNITGLRIGPFALSTLTGTTFGMVGMGPGALGLLTNGNAEHTAIGVRAGGSAVSGFGCVFIGESAGSSDDPSNCVVIGNDAARDATGISGSTLIGIQAGNDGNAGNNTVVGALSLRGSAGTLELAAAAVHAGDVYSVVFSTTSGQTTIPTSTATYTTTGGDTAATIATALGTAINALGISYAYTQPAGMNFPATTLGTNVTSDVLGNGFVGLHIQGSDTTGAKLTMTPSCTGTCNITISSIGAFTGSDNIVVGMSAMGSPGPTTASRNVVIGDGNAGAASGAFSDNALVGYNAGKNATTDLRNVMVGSNAGFTARGTTDSVLLGYKAGNTITTGVQNIVIGSAQVNGSTITTGNTNVVIGYGASVPSATTNNQLSIMDALYGGSNNKGAGGGYGWLGTYCTANNGNASFTLCDAGGNNTTYGNHFGVLQTTAPGITNATLDSKASDVAGTLTLTAANPVVTFHVAFATTPHCVVSSPSGTAFTYTKSTTALTITGGASGNTLDYVCVQ